MGRMVIAYLWNLIMTPLNASLNISFRCSFLCVLVNLEKVHSLLFTNFFIDPCNYLKKIILQDILREKEQIHFETINADVHSWIELRSNLNNDKNDFILLFKNQLDQFYMGGFSYYHKENYLTASYNMILVVN